MRGIELADTMTSSQEHSAYVIFVSKNCKFTFEVSTLQCYTNFFFSIGVP